MFLFCFWSFLNICKASLTVCRDERRDPSTSYEAEPSCKEIKKDRDQGTIPPEIIEAPCYVNEQEGLLGAGDGRGKVVRTRNPDLSNNPTNDAS